MTHHQARLIHLHLHVGEAERDGLVDVNRGAERLALGGVLDRVLKRRARHADFAGGEHDARLIELAHQALEAHALGADAAILRQEDILEEDLVRRDRALAELMELVADGEALVAVLDDEGGDALAARARGDRGEDDVERRHAGVGDPGLGAVQLVAAVDLLRVRGDATGVGAGLGLGRGERAELRLGAGQRAHPALLLRLITERDHGAREERGRADKVADRRIAEDELLVDARRGGEVHDPAAAEVLGQVVTGEADLGRLVERIPRGLLDLVVVRCDRADLVRGEVAREGDKVVLDIDGGDLGHGSRLLCRTDVRTFAQVLCGRQVVVHQHAFTTVPQHRQQHERTEDKDHAREDVGHAHTKRGRE